MDITALVQQAMNQNGMSPQPQMTPGSPGFNPATAPQAPMPMGGAPSSPMGQMPQSKSQEDIIIQALTKQLERLDKQKQMGLT